MIEVIRRDAIDAALREVRRQYLAGDLKLPQEVEHVPSTEVEIGITRYRDHAAEAPHWHPQATEYQYMLSGWTSYLDTDTGEEFHFTAGDFYVISPGTRYAQKSKPGTAILFVKVPSVNDKTPVEASADVERWMGEALRTVRQDFFHDDAAPEANSVRPAAAVAVIDDGQVLLVRRRDNGKWSLPGGTLEMGEDLPSCALREVREETGLDVEVTDIVGTYTDPEVRIAYSDGEVRREFTIVFAARTRSRDVTIDSESSEFGWFLLDDLDDLDLAWSQRVRLGDLVRYLEYGKRRLS